MKLIVIGILIILLLFSLGLMAQENISGLKVYSATPAEQQALEKAIPVIENVLDHFNSNDWEKTQDYYSGDVSVNKKPVVPIDINCNFERQYTVRYNSNRYNTLLKPLVDKTIELGQQQNYTDAEKLGKQIKALENLTVDVYINRENTGINTPENPGTKINVPGVTLCYKLGKNQYDSDGNAYWLLFGNWKTATMQRYGLAYHFIHPRKTPYIENVAIIITGADDRIQQLLKTVDWGSMQNALTP